jgi:hypothetical protein
MERFEQIMRVVIVLAVVLAAMACLSAITGGGR